MQGLVPDIPHTDIQYTSRCIPRAHNIFEKRCACKPNIAQIYCVPTASKPTLWVLAHTHGVPRKQGRFGPISLCADICVACVFNLIYQLDACVSLSHVAGERAEALTPGLVPRVQVGQLRGQKQGQNIKCGDMPTRVYLFPDLTENDKALTGCLSNVLTET